MTLERHRSKLIPSVTLEGDGKLSIGPSMGRKMTREPPSYRHSYMDLPISQGPPGAPPDGGMTANDTSLPKNNLRVDEYAQYSDYQGRRGRGGHKDDERSYRSFDPQRDARRAQNGKFKGRQDAHAYRDELNAMPGTWGSKSSGSQSIQRKLRKAREKRLSRENGGYPNSTISTGKRRKRRGGTPQMSPENVYPGSLNRTKAMRNVDLKALKKVMKDDPAYANGYMKAGSVNGGPSLLAMPMRNKKIVEEKLPGLYFLVLGSMLLVLGLIHIFVSWWHLLGCALWTGFLLTILGWFGIQHKGDYLTKSTNVRYMLVAFLSSAGALVTIWMSAKTALQVLIAISNDVTVEQVAHNVTFTNQRKSIVGNIEVDPMLWVSLGTELSSIVLSFLSFYSLSALVMCLDNHWEAKYVSTTQCDHWGHPRYFNPIEQISLGQLSILLGIIAMLLLKADVNHYHVPVWAGIVAGLSGFISLCQGKRGDLMNLSVLAMFMELVAMASCSGGIVVMTLSLVDDIQELKDKDLLEGSEYGERLAAAISAVCFLLAMMVNLILAVGIAFRICRKNWCGSTLMGPPIAADNISIA